MASSPRTFPYCPRRPAASKETEVAPIEKEDDNSHVICPTCYDFLPKAHYLLHKRSQNCYSPSRPPEIVKAHGSNLTTKTPWGGAALYEASLQANKKTDGRLPTTHL